LTVVEPALFEWDVFEMAAQIQSPTKCEVRYITWILNATGERPAEIHKQTVAVYGNVMNRQNLTKGCREFSEGLMFTINKGTVCHLWYLDELVQKTEEETHAKRRVTIRELHHIIPEVSETTIHEALTEKLGYRKLCARCVPKMLMGWSQNQTDTSISLKKIMASFLGQKMHYPGRLHTSWLNN
jgi:hypothetical protein